LAFGLRDVIFSQLKIKVMKKFNVEEIKMFKEILKGVVVVGMLFAGFEVVKFLIVNLA
tara:strand:- start:653 stop:826 length:174 start_codon:yes stop_codon:yes gene_type:complete